MAKVEDERTSSTRAFEPFLDPNEREKLHDLLSVNLTKPSRVAEMLRKFANGSIDDGSSAKLRTICLLVADLFDQGWQVTVKSGAMLCEPPSINQAGDQTVGDVKLRIREALLASRQRQLQEPSVSTFIKRMERPIARPKGRTSVLGLVDHGGELADKLESIQKLSGTERETALSKVIDPIIEVCTSGDRCTDTGLLLNDIWRYFRHTWAHEYRPIPGRQVLILIRNAARPKRPVIGIAMLASPVMRLNARDNWIGWLRGSLDQNLQSGHWNALALAHALLERLEASINDVRSDDLVSAEEIASPVETTILRLEQRAAGAAFERDLELRAHYEVNIQSDGGVRPLRGSIKTTGPNVNWREASEDPLFVRKRAQLLAQLLSAKQTFCAADLIGNPVQALPQLLAATTGQRAIDIVLTEFRKAGLSSRVADVSICGAVAPYNELIGGKLVALLLCSKEIREHYSKRYSDQVSVISSQMAGRPISKPADLRVLTTTSLYGIGSSQYNRLSLRAGDHPGLENDLRWDSIGGSKTGGFGTLHLGADTAYALRQMAQTLHTSRRINNRFGEGTSPRLRQIREGLDALGINSNAILHHNTPRLFYACELDVGSRNSLMGMEVENFHASSAADIAAAWRRRWLDGRSKRSETLANLRLLVPGAVQSSLHPVDEDLFSD